MPAVFFGYVLDMLLLSIFPQLHTLFQKSEVIFQMGKLHLKSPKTLVNWGIFGNA